MKVEDLLVDLTISALRGDTKETRSIALTSSRVLRKQYPEHAARIASAIAQRDAGAEPLRAVGIMPIPADQESRLSLASVESPSSDEQPIFESGISQRIQRFLEQHLAGEKLLANGLEPPSSLLVIGEPGVGKTLLARHLACLMGRKLVVLDLAAAMSSLLGKTGQNLKMMLSFARENPTVLLLDEFDAIAKRRDDSSDLGELKRIVNVLLKELEDWPYHSLLIAATNHPDLLDKAIWRRFDEVIEIPIPCGDVRTQIVERSAEHVPEDYRKILVDLTEGMSAAAVVQACRRISRRTVLEPELGFRVIIEELLSMLGSKSKRWRPKLVKLLKEHVPEITYNEIAASIGIGVSTVCYHLKEGTHGR